MNRPLTIALAGNPNCGKTSIFNAMTGSRQKVGNYPGVTVDKIEGRARFHRHDIRIIDLPGTYSLTAYSEDEVVARNFILDEQPDVIVNIVDASNLERHLYLTTQLLELEVPMVLALNMVDVARSRGYHFDVERLALLLGVEIIETIGHRREGTDRLLAAATRAARDAENRLARLRRPNYGTEVEPHIRQLARQIAARTNLPRARWFALKLIEGDELAPQRMNALTDEPLNELLAEAARLRSHIETVCGDLPEIILADRRYGYISGACAEAVRHPTATPHTLSDQLDHVLAHPIWGLPIFAAAMYALFQLTFLVGNPLVDLLDGLIHNHLAGWLVSLWPAGSAPLLRSLVLDGIVGGVGAVLVFVPLIVLLFLGVALLEDTGYMARAAFVMDRLMHRIGLHGKSFVPMLIGFGCTVPAILATRTLENRRDRLTTILVVPLMSCGARLPIYMLIIPAFFGPAWQGPIYWSIYVIGIVLAVAMARLFRSTLFRGQAAPFVMELPPYRLPTLRGLGLHVLERTWMYVRKAGTIILLASVILWAVTTFPRQEDHTALRDEFLAEVESRASVASPAWADAMRSYYDATLAPQSLSAREPAVELAPPPAPSDTGDTGERIDERLQQYRRLQQRRELEYSIAGRIGRGLEPVLRTMGFDWKIGTAMVAAFAAKEIFVSQLGIVYAVSDGENQADELTAQLRADYTPLVGFCICLFMLITMPCVATFAVTVREAGGWRWGLGMLGYLTVLAWLVTTAVYQLGQAMG